MNCHMPATTFMGVDVRRDHSFRVPEPQLTLDFDIPNACNRCHADHDAEWAVATLRAWRGDAPPRTASAVPAHAPVFEAAQQNHPGALPGLLAIARDHSRPDIIRATAVRESSRFPSPETLALLQESLGHESPLVRAAAASSLEGLPLAERYGLLQPLITDPVKAVRMRAAASLAELSPDQLDGEARSHWQALRTEYLDSLATQADLPETQMNLGNFLARSGNASEAERAYRRSLNLAPRFVPAMVNLADLYRENGMDAEARKLLQKAIELEPALAAPRHALGLLLVRIRQPEQALVQLREAMELEPGNARYAYVYAVALYGQGRRQEAVAILEATLQHHPRHPEVVSALMAYYHELGEVEKLRALEMEQQLR